MSHDTPISAFHWRKPPAEPQAPKPVSPQLAYYRRKMAAGTHPKQLRKAGQPVIDQRFHKNRGKTGATHAMQPL